MKITLNNSFETVEGNSITIDNLLKVKNFTFKMLIIKVNGNLIQKEDYAATSIKEGDDVSVLHLISGG
ncbi:MAG: sulfur carrier protein ThiS [Bacteroidales bacterium]|jgi:thiamine biosynthesis protein ThiS